MTTPEEDDVTIIPQTWIGTRQGIMECRPNVRQWWIMY